MSNQEASDRPSFEDAIARLLAPGSPFELAEDVSRIER
jgi:hypothetical protein